MHCVFSTKGRRPLLTAAIRERLWPYLGGIAREHDMKALAIGGVADHVHLLLSLPATLSVSKATQLLKGNSSKWLRETFPELRPQGFCVAGRFWRIQHRRFGCGGYDSLHPDAGGASPEEKFSRGVGSVPQEARI